MLRSENPDLVAVIFCLDPTFQFIRSRENIFFVATLQMVEILELGTQATQAEAEVRLLPPCATPAVVKTALVGVEWFGLRHGVRLLRSGGNRKQNLVLREETSQVLLSLKIE